MQEPLWQERLEPDIVIDGAPYIDQWYKAWNAHVSQKGYGMYKAEPGEKYDHQYLLILDAAKSASAGDGTKSK